MIFIKKPSTRWYNALVAKWQHLDFPDFLKEIKESGSRLANLKTGEDVFGFLNEIIQKYPIVTQVKILKSMSEVAKNINFYTIAHEKPNQVNWRTAVKDAHFLFAFQNSFESGSNLNYYFNFLNLVMNLNLLGAYIDLDEPIFPNIKAKKIWAGTDFENVFKVQEPKSFLEVLTLVFKTPAVYYLLPMEQAQKQNPDKSIDYLHALVIYQIRMQIKNPPIDGWLSVLENLCSKIDHLRLDWVMNSKIKPIQEIESWNELDKVLENFMKGSSIEEKIRIEGDMRMKLGTKNNNILGEHVFEKHKVLL